MEYGVHYVEDVDLLHYDSHQNTSMLLHIDDNNKRHHPKKILLNITINGGHTFSLRCLSLIQNLR